MRGTVMIVQKDMYLSHHGILGMKGGVRRTPEQLGHRIKSNRSNDISKMTKRNKEKGMTDEKAASNARMKRRVKDVAAVALSKVSGRLYKDYIGGALNVGRKLKTVASSPNLEGSKFYAAYRRGDVRKYKGIMAINLKDEGKEAYSITNKVRSKIKIAPRNKAAKVVKDLLENNSEFRRMVVSDYETDKLMSWTKKHTKALDAMGKLLKGEELNGRELKQAYDWFNFTLVNQGGSDKIFYAKLKELGYGAIHDMNDINLSGFRAKSPAIIFDMASVSPESFTHLTGAAKNAAIAESFIRVLTDNGKAVVGVAGAAAGTKYILDDKEKR